MIYAADPSAYTAADDPPTGGKVINAGIARTGGTTTVTFTNADWAGDPVTDPPSGEHPGGAAKLAQQAPDGVLVGPRWLAAIRITAQSVDFGDSVSEAGNGMSWGLSVTQVSGPSIFVGVADLITDGSAPEAVPYWLGISAFDGGWFSGIWGYPDPVLGSTPPEILGGGSTAGMNLITRSDSSITWGAGLASTPSGPFVIASGGASITIDAYLFEGDEGGIIEPPTGTTGASWGILAR